MSVTINQQSWLKCLLDEGAKKLHDQEPAQNRVCPECGDKLWPQGGCFVCLLCGYESCE